MPFTISLAILFLFISTPFAEASRVLPKFPEKNLARSSQICSLFPEGIQDSSEKIYQITSYSSVLTQCHWPAGQPSNLLAIREMKIGHERYLLTVDPSSLKTQILNATCLVCQPAREGVLTDSRYGRALEHSANNYQVSKQRFLVAAGLKHGENKSTNGVYISADLCPSPKALEREFFKTIESLQSNAPIALAVAGKWILGHPREFAWLKAEVALKRLKITWVNHSFSHPARKDEPHESNFLLSPSIDMEREVLGTEKVMIANGITPSVFFRFPALVSDIHLMHVVRSHQLIPLSSDAWLAIGQEPKVNSIILVHANGNEAKGIKRLQEMIAAKNLPLPLLELEEAPLATDNQSSFLPAPRRQSVDHLQHQ